MGCNDEIENGCECDNPIIECGDCYDGPEPYLEHVPLRKEGNCWLCEGDHVIAQEED